MIGFRENEEKIVISPPPPPPHTHTQEVGKGAPISTIFF